MCDYCKMPSKDLKFHRQETDTNIQECFIHEASDGYSIMLRQNITVRLTEKFGVKLDQECKYAFLEINYCPICGRDLRSEENGKSQSKN